MVTGVLGYPGTQIPVSTSSAAAQTQKGEQIVYGTRVPGYPCLPGPGYPIPVPPQPPRTRSGTRFLRGRGATLLTSTQYNRDIVVTFSARTADLLLLGFEFM